MGSLRLLAREPLHSTCPHVSARSESEPEQARVPALTTRPAALTPRRDGGLLARASHGSGGIVSARVLLSEMGSINGASSAASASGIVSARVLLSEMAGLPLRFASFTGRSGHASLDASLVPGISVVPMQRGVLRRVRALGVSLSR